MRFVLHLPRHALRLIFGVVFVLVVVFFALTRTQVGRDALRDQIVLQFDDAFAGQLEIGTLKGNLLNQLYASDLRLLDANGHIVLEVDSAVIEHDWRDLVRRRLTIRRLRLFRPTFLLARTEAEAWNVAAALQPTHPAEPSPYNPASAWGLNSATVEIVDGTVDTANDGARPALISDGTLFDFTNARLTDLYLDAAIEQENDRLLLDVMQSRFRLPLLGLTVHRLSGQVVHEPERLALFDVALQTDESALAGRFSLTHRGERQVELSLSRATVDPVEAMRLFPVYPFRQPLQVAADLAGPAGAVQVQRLRVETGTSQLQASGEAALHADSLAYRLRIGRSLVRLADLQRLLPDLPLMRFASLPQVELTGALAGAVPFSEAAPFRLSSAFTAGLEESTTEGTFSFVQFPGEEPRLLVDVGIERLNPDWIANTALNSRLTGRARLKSTPEGFQTELDLQPSVLLGRQIEGLSSNLTLGAQLVSGTARLAQGNGALDIAGTYAQDAFDVTVSASHADLGSLLRLDSLHTDLNGTLRVQGTGSTLDDLSATADLLLQPSATTWKGERRSVHALRTRAELNAPSAAAPRLVVTGDILDLRVSTSVALEPLADAAAQWGHSFARTLEAEWNKTRTLPAAAEVPLPSVLQAAPTLDAHVSLHLKRADLLAALLPLLPDDFRGEGTATLHAAVENDRLDFRLDLDTPSLTLAGTTWQGTRLTFESLSGFSKYLAETSEFALSVQADSASVAGQAVRSPALIARFQEREASVHLVAAQVGQGGFFEMQTGLHLLPDRNRVSLTAFSAGADGYRWQLPEPAEVDVYADAITFNRFTLATDDGQQLALSGEWSESGALHARARNVALVDILHRVGVPDLGGTLDADLTLTGGLARPEVTGTTNVAAFTWENRVVGDISATSRFLPASSNLGLDLRLDPAGLEGARENDLTLTGSFRLPGPDDWGVLDMQADVRRADLFFLEILFPEILGRATGYGSGSGRIAGSFHKPYFDADLRLHEGDVTIPAFDLHFMGEGPVRFTDRTLHFPGLDVTDGRGGTARVAGRIVLDNLDDVYLDVSGDLDRLRVINAPASPDLAFYGTIAASGSVTLVGPASAPFLRAPNLVVTPQSELFLPLSGTEREVDESFIVFANRAPDPSQPAPNRSETNQRDFVEALAMNLNFQAEGARVHLVFDPLLGDVISATGSGRIQLQRTDGDFALYGTLDVTGGDYLFSASEIFTRRFLLDPGGTISWSGDPANAALDIPASYRTRASVEGLPDDVRNQLRSRAIPLVVKMQLTGDVQTPLVTLQLEVDEDERGRAGANDFLETRLNRSDLRAEYATSVLLTNSFLLTTALVENSQALGSAASGLAFNSLSQLVSSSINRFVSGVLENVDVTLGVQQGMNEQNYDLTYGVALRLLDERLVIRGEGVYQTDPALTENVQGEIVLQVQLNDKMSVEVFYRREGDLLGDDALSGATYGSYGAGLSYQTEFANWKRFLQRLRGEVPPTAPADSTRVSTES